MAGILKAQSGSGGAGSGGDVSCSLVRRDLFGLRPCGVGGRQVRGRRSSSRGSSRCRRRGINTTVCGHHSPCAVFQPLSTTTHSKCSTYGPAGYELSKMQTHTPGPVYRCCTAVLYRVLFYKIKGISFIFCLCFLCVHYLCSKYYKHVTMQPMVFGGVSSLTLLDLQKKKKNWTYEPALGTELIHM